MENPIETIDYKGHEIKIFQDQDAQNPRTDYDNFGTMICFHGRYDLGDKHSMSIESAQELATDTEKAGGIVLPLFLYDHSGITINTTGFSCPWDSGQVGVILVSAEDARKEFGRQFRKRATALLKGEVETYDQYLRGDVYGFVIEGPDTEESCWGFFGEKYAIEEAKSEVDSAFGREKKEAKKCADACAL